MLVPTAAIGDGPGFGARRRVHEENSLEFVRLGKAEHVAREVHDVAHAARVDELGAVGVLHAVDRGGEGRSGRDDQGLDGTPYGVEHFPVGPDPYAEVGQA